MKLQRFKQSVYSLATALLLTGYAAPSDAAWAASYVIMGTTHVKIKVEVDPQSMKVGELEWACTPETFCPKNLQYSNGFTWYLINGIAARPQGQKIRIRATVYNCHSSACSSGESMPTVLKVAPPIVSCENAGRQCPASFSSKALALQDDGSYAGYIDDISKIGYSSLKISFPTQAVFNAAYEEDNGIPAPNLPSRYVLYTDSGTNCSNPPGRTADPREALRAVSACVNLGIYPNVTSALFDSKSETLSIGSIDFETSNSTDIANFTSAGVYFAWADPAGCGADAMPTAVSDEPFNVYSPYFADIKNNSAPAQYVRVIGASTYETVLGPCTLVSTQ